MVHDAINHSPKRRPHGRQIQPLPARRDLHLGVPYALVDVVGQLGHLLDEGADCAEAWGDGGRGWPEGHAASADAVLVEGVAGFGAEGGQKAGCYREDSVYFVLVLC